MTAHTATEKFGTKTITFYIEHVTGHAAPATAHIEASTAHTATATACIEAVHWKLIEIANTLEN